MSRPTCTGTFRDKYARVYARALGGETRKAIPIESFRTKYARRAGTHARYPGVAVRRMGRFRPHRAHSERGRLS